MQLSSLNSLKPGVKLMSALLQLHLSYQQFYRLLRCDLYQRFYGNNDKKKVTVLNILRPRQNCCHFVDDLFKCIFFNENVWISIKNSLNFVRKVRINNIPALVQIMAWCQPGDKSLSETVMVRFSMHIGVTWPHWVKGDNIMKMHSMTKNSDMG